MATLILGTIGRVVAGPVGGIVGTLLGGGIDRALIGGRRGREQGRSSNPAVQSATYGEPIPLIIGRMRAAGNLIWTSGIQETAATAGGGKSRAAGTSFSYSASFAVGLAGLRITGIDRIWADGKLLRDAAGAFAVPMTMRIYTGDADQMVDPLIAAAEGVGMTPAYRGLAYAVFENMPLGEFGNRIPNLTFEIVGEVEGRNDGDAAALAIDGVIRSLTAAAGCTPLPLAGQFPALSGYIVGQAGSLADALAPLLAVSDAAIIAGDGLRIARPGDAPQVIEAEGVDARRPGDARPPERLRRAAADAQPASLELAFYDTSRDYQPGLQRARRSAAARIEHQSIAAAMSPAEAKALAIQLLTNGQAARVQRRARLSWRHVGIVPGALIRFADDAIVWRVREARFENFIVHLELERRLAGTGVGSAAARMADGGRALLSESQPAGPTTLHVLDLPLLTGELPATPRLWIAGNGSEAGWRRAGVLVSLDGGDSFVTAGSLEGGTTIGVALTTLPDAATWGWDEFLALDVELLSDRDWLEPRSKAAVLGGANLALVGDELIQFRTADAIGPRRFRLGGLLRGRRGTEVATRSHVGGERFILVDPARMLAFDPPLDTLGRAGMAQSAGSGDSDAVAVPFRIDGRALRPPSPAHLRATVAGGDIRVSWVRRSRAGFTWTDFVDAPLGEADERYEVQVFLDGRPARTVQVVAPWYCYAALDRLADGGGSVVVLRVAQWSGAVGPGDSETIAVNI